MHVFDGRGTGPHASYGWRRQAVLTGRPQKPIMRVTRCGCEEEGISGESGPEEEEEEDEEDAAADEPPP